jgi:hypothetical protein
LHALKYGGADAMQAVVVKRQMRARPEYKCVAMAEVNVSYPQVITKSSPAGAVISRFYSEAASVYYSYGTGDFYKKAVDEYINDRKNHVPFRTYTAMMTFEVLVNLNDFISIFVDIYEFTGGAHGNTGRRADTWSLKTGRHMQLADLFSGAWQNVIFSSILSQINEQLSKGMNIYFDDYQKNVFKYFDEKNFYLTPEGVAVYYPLYTIAPYSSGIVTFIIPYSEFDGMLKYGLLPK